MTKTIEAWESEDGGCVVIGTHDRIEGLIALQKWFKENCDMDFNNTHFAGIRSRKRWARSDWETCDEGEPIATSHGLGFPMLWFDESPEAWS